MPETIQQERTYAERVTGIYKRIQNDSGENKAKAFNEFVRGASLLGGAENKFLDQIENMETEELREVVDKYEQIEDGLKQQYKTNTVYEAFEKVREAGRTKLFLWQDGKYNEVDVPDEDKEGLPWAGEIRSGGPSPAVTGIVGVGQDYDIKLLSGSIEINGHRFALNN